MNFLLDLFKKKVKEQKYVETLYMDNILSTFTSYKGEKITKLQFNHVDDFSENSLILNK